MSVFKIQCRRCETSDDSDHQSFLACPRDRHDVAALDAASMAGLVPLEVGPQCKKAVVMDFGCWILVSVMPDIAPMAGLVTPEVGL